MPSYGRKQTNLQNRKYNYMGSGEKKTRKLDMRKNEEFNFMLGKAVESLPDSVRGALKGSIYSIASKRSMKEARDFVNKKKDEGVIDEEMRRKLIDLLSDYSKFR
ncbi:MAG: hypothetical protein QW812_01255 [Thermoplasmataceae archaeon]